MAAGSTGDAAAASADHDPGAGETTLVLAHRFEVHVHSPLPEFDRPSAAAFDVRDRTDVGRPLVALVSGGDVPVRGNLAALLKRTEIPGLMKLVEWGPVAWPQAEDCRFAFVYERPAGGPAATLFQQRDRRASDLELTRRLLRLIAGGLQTLAEANLAHRAIRPDNLWLAADGDSAAVLGDAASGPPGYDQPVAFEPIERAMAMPAGRGAGSIADDLFALGVTLLTLVTGRDFGGDFGDLSSEQELLHARIERGSYGALTAGLRVPQQLVDPLRGLLGDELSERWSLRDLQAWLAGRPPSTRVSHTRRLPDAPFPIGGRTPATPRAVALALTRAIPEAATAIRGGALEGWVRNSLRDPPRAKVIASLATAAGERANSDEALVSRAALVLDPAAPVRHRGFAFCADGFGAALAQLVLRGASVQAAAEALVLRLAEGVYRPPGPPGRPERQGVANLMPPGSRSGAPAPGAHDNTAPLSEAVHLPKFAALTAWVRNPHPGYGVERVLYETNQTLPCLSSQLKGRCVTGLRLLLPALEASSAGGGPARPMVDRHIAAFVAARSRDPLDEALALLADPAPTTQTLGSLALLAGVLDSWPESSLPNLAKRAGRMLPPVVAGFRNRDLRDTVEEEVQRAVAAGDLKQLYAAVGDPKRRLRDHEGFQAAAARFARASAEIERLQKGGAQQRRLAEATGMQAASGISCLAAIVSVCLSLLLALR